MKENNDHHIIVEILIFLKNHSKNEVLFITGDLNPFLIARDKGIPTINWREKKYKEILHKKKIKEKKPPKLEILFDVEEGKREIEVFIGKKQPEFLKFENSERNPKTMKQKFKMNQEIFDKAVEEYNKIVTEYNHFRAIGLILKNNAEHPYSNIDIIITITIEKEIDMHFLGQTPELISPMKFDDSINIQDFWTNIFRVACSRYRKQGHFTINRTGVVKKELDDKIEWIITYSKNHLKHGVQEKTDPLYILLPDNPKTKRIVLNCSFTQNESGNIKDQKLVINLKK